MHPCGLVCHDLLCLGLRSLESGELSCPSQSFCQQVHGVVAKIMIRRLHLPPMYHKVYVSWCIATFLVLATVELFERAGTEGFWTCLSKHEWSGMWWKLTLFPKLRRASMVFLYGTLSKPEWTGWRWKLIVFCRTSIRFQTPRKLHNYVHWNSQCNTNVTLDWICIYRVWGAVRILGS